MALLAVQGLEVLLIGEKFAWMTMGIGEARMPLQIDAAKLNAFSRCWPRVVPGLPPIGVAGVGSLNPTPAPSPFSIVIDTRAKALPVMRTNARSARRNV